MIFEEWFKTVTKQDYEHMLQELGDLGFKSDLDNLDKWIKLIYNAGWNAGKDSKTTQEILKELEHES